MDRFRICERYDSRERMTLPCNGKFHAEENDASINFTGVLDGPPPTFRSFEGFGIYYNLRVNYRSEFRGA